MRAAGRLGVLTTLAIIGFRSWLTWFRFKLTVQLRDTEQSDVASIVARLDIQALKFDLLAMSMSSRKGLVVL
jgi:hypothetical protein